MTDKHTPLDTPLGLLEFYEGSHIVPEKGEPYIEINHDDFLSTLSGVKELTDSHHALKEENDRLRDALDLISCMHPGSPGLRYMHMSELEYCHKVIGDIHRFVKSTLEETKGA